MIELILAWTKSIPVVHISHEKQWGYLSYLALELQ